MAEFRVTCPICKVEHTVPSRAYRYCPNHTEKERANFARKRYNESPRGRAVRRLQRRAYRARKGARTKGQRTQSLGPNYNLSYLVSREARMNPEAPCHGCPVSASCFRGWVDVSTCGHLIDLIPDNARDLVARAEALEVEP
jgi:hypothetical protein